MALATTLGLGMTALQFGIGAVNDLVDVARDARSKPGKPIPSGLVDPGVARVVAAAAFAVGLLLSALAGPPTLLIAVLVAGIGLAYDLVLKGTRWSWVGFAVGIPLLPVYAWLGATGSLPLAFAVLVPAAVASGAGLALANGLADAERDRSAGVDSVVGSLGAARAVTASRLLQGGVAIAALVSLAASAASKASARTSRSWWSGSPRSRSGSPSPPIPRPIGASADGSSRPWAWAPSPWAGWPRSCARVPSDRLTLRLVHLTRVRREQGSRRSCAGFDVASSSVTRPSRSGRGRSRSRA